MESKLGYTLVRMSNGAYSLHSQAYGETMHPGVGPVAEAEVLYVRQHRLVERLQRHAGEFVLWDIGLGGAANALTVLRAASLVPGTARTADSPCPQRPDLETPAGDFSRASHVPPAADGDRPLSTGRVIRLLSFDNSAEPLRFALQHAEELGYLDGFESCLRGLLSRGNASFQRGTTRVEWQLQVADFPALIRQPEAGQWPKPHMVMFDPFSPARNPAMWTQPLFTRLFSLLDREQPCVMPTYSRSTMLRVSLLLAGFFVGAGHAVGNKEETTLATNDRELLEAPLDQTWLAKAQLSTSAEPLWQPIYRRAALSADSWERLRAHPQFAVAQVSR